VGRQGAVVRIDAASLTSVGSIQVPDHRAADPLVVVGHALWVVDPAGIDRIEVSTGVRATPLSITPSSLIVAGDMVWAADGGMLLGIDPTSGQITRTAALPREVSAIDAVANHGDAVWVAARGPGGPLLIGVDPTTGQTEFRTPLTPPAVSIADVGNQVWTLDSHGRIDRYAPSS
jgi:hypothetical protein